MRKVAGLLTLMALFCCQESRTQTEPPFAPGAQAQGPQQPVQQFYAEDGGTMTLVNERRIARDSAGRIYQERWLLVPKMGKAQSRMTTIQINDPVKHIHYACFMSPKRECTLNNYSVSTNAIYKFQGPPTGPLRGDAGYALHDDLGQQIIQGLETSGTRDRLTYNPGVLGNDQKMTIEREFWYSPQLGFNLLSKLSDPRIGTETFTVTEFLTSEPDQMLFSLPEGFKVIDERQAAPPTN